MAKGIDPFEKFKAATLGEPSLSEAIKPSPASVPSTDVVEAPVVADNVIPEVAPVKKVSKTANKEQMCFYIDKGLKKRLARLKYEQDLAYNDALEEAIIMLLAKYGIQ